MIKLTITNKKFTGRYIIEKNIIKNIGDNGEVINFSDDNDPREDENLKFLLNLNKGCKIENLEIL